LVNDPMVKGLQSNANALSSHRKNNFIVMVLITFSIPVLGNGERNIAKALSYATVFCVNFRPA
jgi:hypothetical protein